MSNDTYRPTEGQVDRMISLNEKAMDYTHKERTQVLPQHRFDRLLNLVVFLIGSIFLLIVFGLVLAFKPEYTDIVLTAIVTFIGGYGVGNALPLKRKTPDSSSID